MKYEKSETENVYVKELYNYLELTITTEGTPIKDILSQVRVSRSTLIKYAKKWGYKLVKAKMKVTRNILVVKKK